MSRLWRAYDPDIPLEVGASFALREEEIRHVRQVLRLGPGDSLAVFDGRGNEWSAVIEASEPRHVALRLESPITNGVEPLLSVTLYQGLCKPERMERVIEKATEIGAAEILPLGSRRAARQHAVTAHRLTRWRRIAVEACKQCGRRSLPRVEICEDLPPCVPRGTLGILLDAGVAAPPLGTIVEGPRPGRVWLAVGPESGFADEELETWATGGWVRAGLGPRILRADSAGLVASSIVLHRWDDLGRESRAPAGC